MKKLLLLLPFFGILGFAQSAQRISTAIQINPVGGNYALVIPNASVYVCVYNSGLNCSTPLGIYSDVNLTRLISQPVIANSQGVYQYYISNGTQVVEKVCAPAGQCSFNAVYIGNPSGSGSGTVSIGSTGQIAVYNQNGTTVGGTSAITTALTDKGGQVFNIEAYGADPTFGADSTSAIQSAVTAAEAVNGAVYIPQGIFKVSPSSHSGVLYSILLGNGAVITGPGTLKVANSVGSYNEIFYGPSCNSCQFSQFTVNSNVANNPLVSSGDLLTYPRNEFYLDGSNIVVSGITVENSSSLQNIIIDTQSTSGGGNKVTNSYFLNLGDDPNHIVHDMSPVYVSGTGATGSITLENNVVEAVSFAAPAAGGGTCYETHGTMQTVTGNTCYGFGRGINVTGVDLQNDESISVTGNSFIVPYMCIDLWSEQYSTHTSGFGLRGVAVVGNSCTIHQVGFFNANVIVSGIQVEAGSNLPIQNINITGNTINFDLEQAFRSGNLESTGIGMWAGVASTNVTISDNHITNAPVSAIAWDGLAENLKIHGNTILDDGASEDGSINSAYKVPVYLNLSSASAEIEVSNNSITDDLSTSVLGHAFLTACAANVPNMKFLDNDVLLLGATTTSWGSYFNQQDNHCDPLVRMTAIGKAWGTPSNTMQGGSQVYDRTLNEVLSLPVDGTNFVNIIPNIVTSSRGSLGTSIQLSDQSSLATYCSGFAIDGTLTNGNCLNNVSFHVEYFPDADQTTTNWSTCVLPGCNPGGSGTPVSTSQTLAISVPGLTNAPSTRFQLVANANSTNSLWVYKINGGDNACDYCTRYYWQSEVCIDSTSYSNVGQIEMDMFQFDATLGKEFMWGMQWNKSIGFWQVFNQATLTWETTSFSTPLNTGCHLVQVWDHRIEGDLTECSGQPCQYYDAIALDGSRFSWNLSYPASNIPGGFTSTSGFQFQLDIPTASVGSPVTANLYINNSQIYAGTGESVPFHFTTTSGSSDALNFPSELGEPSICDFSPTNTSAATNIATTYSTRSSSALTLNHTTTSGMTFDASCYWF